MNELLIGFGLVCLYFVACASIALIIRLKMDVPKEVFRKLLHFILLGSVFFWLFAFETWFLAAVASLIFALIVYPILAILEKLKGYSQLLTERKSGEIKKSLLVVFTMFSIVITVCWGLFNDQLLALCSVLAWGIGDAAAALIGKKYGKRKLVGKYIEGVKSVEGTLAMFIISFVSVCVVLIIRGDMVWYSYLIISIITAAVTSLVELYTSRGMDTFTCPIAAMIVLLPLTYVFGGLV